MRNLLVGIAILFVLLAISADAIGTTDSVQAMVGVRSIKPLSVVWWADIVATHGDVFILRFHARVEGGTGSYKYFWDFGNGKTSTRPNPPKQNYKLGAYVVTLKVTSGTKSAICQGTLILGGAGSGLEVACTSSGIGGIAPYTVRLSAVATGGKKPYAYQWDPGDHNGLVTGASVWHTYLTPGAYLAIVTVTDSIGLRGVCALQIRVTDSPR